MLFDISRRMVADVRPDAVSLLEWLKSNNLKTGLISDCFTDIPKLWNETPFAPLIDITVFSCFAGMNKADIRIFKIALEQLAVKPEKCVYIADGMRNELANASSLGMHSIQIFIPEEVDHSPIRENWKGPAVSSLIEIMELLN